MWVCMFLYSYVRQIGWTNRRMDDQTLLCHTLRLSVHYTEHRADRSGNGEQPAQWIPHTLGSPHPGFSLLSLSLARSVPSAASQTFIILFCRCLLQRYAIVMNFNAYEWTCWNPHPNTNSSSANNSHVLSSASQASPWRAFLLVYNELFAPKEFLNNSRTLQEFFGWLFCISLFCAYLFTIALRTTTHTWFVCT